MASVAATPDLSALRDPDDREQRGLELQAMLHETASDSRKGRDRLAHCG
jgi:hypothetical protein